MDISLLLFKTLLLRPYVFVFLAAALFCAHRLIGWRRTGLFLGILLAGGVALWRERANIEHQQRAIIHQIESGKGPRR